MTTTIPPTMRTADAWLQRVVVVDFPAPGPRIDGMRVRRARLTYELDDTARRRCSDILLDVEQADGTPSAATYRFRRCVDRTWDLTLPPWMDDVIVTSDLGALPLDPYLDNEAGERAAILAELAALDRAALDEVFLTLRTHRDGVEQIARMHGLSEVLAPRIARLDTVRAILRRAIRTYPREEVRRG